jgi:ABC-type sulfate transport system permease subunit
MVVQIRLIYGCASDYGQSQIVISWLRMIPAVGNVLCNQRAIGAYGNNVSCLSASIAGAHYVKLAQWPVIYFPDIIAIAQCYCETLQDHATIVLMMDVFIFDIQRTVHCDIFL